MNKQQLAAKIWESANKMRSKIEANEYKDYILGFIFYKFICDKEVEYARKLGYADDMFIDTDRVFENMLSGFFGGRSLLRPWGGCGLGLALVKMIADAHGATITVDSEPGKGTTVSVALP